MEAITRVSTVLSIAGSRIEEHNIREVDHIWGEVLDANDLTDYVEREDNIAKFSGAVGDVYKGTYYPNHKRTSAVRLWRTLSQPSLDRPIPVAIKVLRSSLAVGAKQDEAKKVSKQRDVVVSI